MAAAASAASAAAARIGAVLSDAQYFESGMVRVEDIRRLLDSTSLKDKLDAMKRVVALISLGRDASVFFPDVVKNVVAPSLDVKKLVYLYLVHYAEDKQDLALLSINSFQKDISDHNELIRALALRVLSSIRVKVILQIVILAINKCSKDPSPYVRKAAAHAISKVTSLDASSRDVLMEPLAVLLNDRSLEVLGSAVAVLDEIAPHRLDLVHEHFRYLCRSLRDMDPSGQVASLRLLLRYGRTQFSIGSGGMAKTDVQSDADLAMLLAHVQPLLMSQKSSVVLGVISLLFHLSDREEVARYAILPLVRLVGSSDAGIQYVALRVTADFAVLSPGTVLPYLSELFVSGADGASVRKAKLAVVSRLCETAGQPGGLGSNPAARKALLNEFQSYLYSSDKSLAASATRAMGCLAAAHSMSTSAVIDLLASVVASSTNAVVVAESVTVLRRLLQLHPDAQDRALPKLISLLLLPRDCTSCITASEARAAIIWLIGEFYDKVPHVAPEALRLLARDFRKEKADVKLQILNLAAKVFCWERRLVKDPTYSSLVSAKTRELLLDYVTSIGISDCDYDVRDKSRMLRNLFCLNLQSPLTALSVANMGHVYDAILGQRYVGKENGKEAKLPTVNEGPKKPSGGAVSVADENHGLILGSFSHVLGSRLQSCRALPAWAPVSSEGSLRIEKNPTDRSGGGVIEIASVSSVDFAYSGGYNGHQIAPTTGNVDVGSRHMSSGTTGLLSRRAVPRFGNPERFYDSASSDPSASSDDEASSGSSYETASDDDRIAQNTRVSAQERTEEIGVLAETSKELPPARLDETAQLFETLNCLPSTVSNARSDLSSVDMKGLVQRWQTTIAGWNAAGVELQTCFVSDSSAAAADATPMAFRIINTGRETVANVSLKSTAIDFDEPVTNCGLSLAAGASSDFFGSCRFAGRTAPIAVMLVRGGDEIGSGEVRPHAGQVLRPLPSFSSRDFEDKERSLSGMFGSTNSFAVTAEGTLASGENAAHLVGRSCRSIILETAFFTEVVTQPSAATSQEKALMRFAGYLPSAPSDTASAIKEVVLLRLAVGSVGSGSAKTNGSGSLSATVPLTLWVGCENIVYANTLLQVLKRELSSNI